MTDDASLEEGMPDDIDTAPDVKNDAVPGEVPEEVEQKADDEAMAEDELKVDES